MSSTSLKTSVESRISPSPHECFDSKYMQNTINYITSDHTSLFYRTTSLQMLTRDPINRYSQNDNINHCSSLKDKLINFNR